MCVDLHAAHVIAYFKQVLNMSNVEKQSEINTQIRIYKIILELFLLIMNFKMKFVIYAKLRYSR